jgi:hypothetical protein
MTLFSKDPRGMKPWNPECLNLAFNLNHPMKECENTTAKQKKLLFDIHKATVKAHDAK